MSILGSGSTHMQGSRRVGHLCAAGRRLLCTCYVNNLLVLQMRAPAAAASAANARCQRCFQQGHWTYQCTGPAVYKARPTRTDQLLNPKVHCAIAVARIKLSFVFFPLQAL